MVNAYGNMWQPPRHTTGIRPPLSFVHYKTEAAVPFALLGALEACVCLPGGKRKKPRVRIRPYCPRTLPWYVPANPADDWKYNVGSVVGGALLGGALFAGGAVIVPALGAGGTGTASAGTGIASAGTGIATAGGIAAEAIEVGVGAAEAIEVGAGAAEAAEGAIMAEELVGVGAGAGL